MSTPTDAGGNRTAGGIDVARAGRRLHPGQVIGWIVALVVLGEIAYLLITTESFQWDVVWAWFRAPSIGRALWTTIWLSAVSMAIGIVLGIVFAVFRLSHNRLLGAVASLYVWFFRGTPLLVQLLFWYNLAALLPRLELGLPFGGPKLFGAATNHVISPLTAAILGLALNEGAYMAEIIRGGLLSVDPGQREAARAYGLTETQALRRVVLPQAMRAIVPPTGNQLINMVKATSQVSVIAMSDLLYTVQSVYNRTFETIPLLVVAVLWYLIVTSVLNVVQSFIEDHFARGTHSGTPSFAGSVKRLARRLRGHGTAGTAPTPAGETA